MNIAVIFMIVGIILIGWGAFRFTDVKGSFLIGWRGFQFNKEKKKEQKK